MGKLAGAILLCLGMTGALLSAAPQLPQIRRVDYVVESYEDGRCTRQAQSLFMLYVGSPETEARDTASARSGVTRNVCLVHPVNEQDGPSGLSGAPLGGGPGVLSISPARSRWYVTETDTSRSLFRCGPLLSRVVWYTIPVLQRHVLMALGPDDDELILVSWNGITDSLSIYYSPRVQTDRRFFERKLESLQSYLEMHELENDVPYERIDPREVEGVLVSSSG